MSDEFYVHAANKRALELDADISEMNSGLMRARAENNEYDAAAILQGLANAKAERRNLDALYREYSASQQPQQQAPMSDAEFMAKSPERMGAEDVDRIMSKSRHYSKDMWSDPEVNQRVRAGVAEIERRKRNGG